MSHPPARNQLLSWPEPLKDDREDSWESAPWDGPPPSVSGEHALPRPEGERDRHRQHDPAELLARAERAEAALVAARNEIALLRARLARLQEK